MMRLTRIDELYRRDHHFLTDTDECYAAGGYTARRGFDYSEMNQLISNLKKPMDRQNLQEWRYKERAIATCANILRMVGKKWVETPGHVFVPVPPSKAQGDPKYDNRIRQIVDKAFAGFQADVREMVTQTCSKPASHRHDGVRSIESLVADYEFVDNLRDPCPSIVVIFDDMITTGAHYKAMQQLIEANIPDVSTIGIFISRREPESDFDVLMG